MTYYYKVGDRVRLVKALKGDPKYAVGIEGTVTGKDGHGTYPIKVEWDNLDKPGDPYPMSKSEIEPIAPKIKKHGITLTMSIEQIALMEGFGRKGHVEYDPITVEDQARWKEAEAALKIVETSEWIELYADFDYTLKPLERRRWVPDETPEEWIARYRKAKANGWKPDDPFRISQIF